MSRYQVDIKIRIYYPLAMEYRNEPSPALIGWQERFPLFGSLYDDDFRRFAHGLDREDQYYLGAQMAAWLLVNSQDPGGLVVCRFRRNTELQANFDTFIGHLLTDKSYLPLSAEDFR